MTHAVRDIDRKVFPGKLAKQVRSQFSYFSQTDMAAYTFTREKSDFRSARADLSVFNLDGKLVLHGRDFGDRTFFWQPLPVA